MVNESDYEKLSKITVEENEALRAWFRHVLLVTSTLLGILISLHPTSQGILLPRLCYSLAAFLLALGILGTFVVLYNFSAISARKVRKTYSDELKNAIREQRDIRIVGVKTPKYVYIIEKVSYGCIGGAFVLLALYSLLLI